jgi:hypothetical protein
MWGDLPVSDAPIAGLAFHTAYTGGGPCNIATSHQKAGFIVMSVAKSTNIETTVRPSSVITYTILGG